MASLSSPESQGTDIYNVYIIKTKTDDQTLILRRPIIALQSESK